jgi:3-hydroxyacyl-CoA dehydrogenase
MTDVRDKPATSPISTRKHGDVLIILSNNPPVNALSTAGSSVQWEASGELSLPVMVVVVWGYSLLAERPQRSNS